jgi:hypothetical protein
VLPVAAATASRNRVVRLRVAQVSIRITDEPECTTPALLSHQDPSGWTHA